MLPRPASLASRRRPAAADRRRRFGVGIDTSRYGHYAAFLRDDLQPAAAELAFAESAAGYAQLRQRLADLAARHGPRPLRRPPRRRRPVRRQPAALPAHALAAVDARPPFTLSCGDPQRNKNYRAALFGARSPTPSRPAPAPASPSPSGPAVPAAVRRLPRLRQVAGRLQAVVRQRTRLINQLHHLLALTFPELALLVKDISAGWVLELLHRYPTAPLLAAGHARPTSTPSPTCPHDRIDAAARSTPATRSPR